MPDDIALRQLMAAIAAGETATVLDALRGAPALATASIAQGATRATATANFLGDISHHIYAGDTALHVAAAARRADIADRLIALGASVAARNRRGATPLHYAADGNPASTTWDPAAQAAVVILLLAAGADANATHRGGVTPLHRAVRNRCAAAVSALLDGGADVQRRNGNGSTATMLATRSTGRGGSGSAEARAEQAAIIALLERHGAAS